MTVRGRYAPSPTGRIHLGNASTALLAWLSVRSRGGAFVVRNEDLDRARVVHGAGEEILRDLAWLGLDWDEGPDVGGPHAPYVQSERTPLYEAALDALRTRGLVYPCFCSRKDVQAAASAPQSPGDEVVYPGTCSALSEAEVSRRVEAGDTPSWRFRVAPGLLEAFSDTVLGTCEPERSALGDFVVRRADGVCAYQLAVVVDDIAMGMTEIVRGGDLMASTARQLLLYRALGAEPPAFGHVPLLLGEDGVRLSKRHQGVTIAELRSAGIQPGSVVARLGSLLGLCPSDRAVRARDLVTGFDLASLRTIPREIRA